MILSAPNMGFAEDDITIAQIIKAHTCSNSEQRRKLQAITQVVEILNPQGKRHRETDRCTECAGSEISKKLATDAVSAGVGKSEPSVQYEIGDNTHTDTTAQANCIRQPQKHQEGEHGQIDHNTGGPDHQELGEVHRIGEPVEIEPAKMLDVSQLYGEVEFAFSV